MAMTTKKMLDAYNERQKKQVSKSENTNLNTNKSGGKSPARLAAEAKKAKLMSEVGTNKTNTKSVLGVTDFKNKAKTGNRDMKGGNRDPQSIPGKNMLKMGKIASDAKKSAKMDSTEKSTRGLKAPAKETKKAPIVTKKMLKDSGYTNLRDYMNAKLGKTRRDGKAASRTAAAKKKDMMSGSFKAGGSVKKMMGGGMTKIKYKGGGIVQQGVRPTRYI